MIRTLFGNWRRRLLTLAACFAAFCVSLVAALSLGLTRSPSSIESVKRFPLFGKVAVAIVESRMGPLDNRPAAEKEEEIPSFRQIAPLSAEEITKLIEALKQQHQIYEDKVNEVSRTEMRLDVYRKELTAERERVEALKQEIAKQWDALNAATQSLNRQITELSEIEAKNLKQLASTYEAMSPDKAASIVAKLDEATATKTLYLMRDRSAAKVLEHMDQDAAARLSQRILLLKTASN